MKNKILLPVLLLILSCTYIPVYAQYENVWAFGGNAGIDFNFNPPRHIQTAINTHEGCASVADANGQLLFYTDGTDVWDRNHTVMPNGKNLPGLVGANVYINATYSTTQGALIVPIPGDPVQYYVFSIGCIECDTNAGRLYYSLIDMSLNNGLGDVVAGSKGIILNYGIRENMTAVLGDNCDIWVLIQDHTNNFKAYNISYTGLNKDPILSGKIAGRPGNGLGLAGSTVISPDRKRLASSQGELIVYDFNPSTGMVANPIILDTQIRSYLGVEFSPDNSKLYGSTINAIYQFDLSLNDTNAIRASRTMLSQRLGMTIKRGPDNKIYCTKVSVGGPLDTDTVLDVINKPNLAGAACDYVSNGISLLAGTNCRLGLPNTIVSIRKTYTLAYKSADCADSMLLRPDNPNGSNYMWEDSSTNQDRYVYETGTYRVTYQNILSTGCEVQTDSFKVILNKIKKTYTTGTFEGMCAADTFLMQPTNPDGSNYIWEDGSTELNRKVNKTGTYWISYRNDSLCEHFADTFLVTYPEKNYEVSFIADTLICQSEAVLFQNTSDSHFTQFNWTFGEGSVSTERNPVHNYPEEGTYQVQLIAKIGDICPDTAHANLIVDAQISIGFVTERYNICAGETVIFRHNGNSQTIIDLIWDFGDGIQQAALYDKIIPHAYVTAGTFPITLTAHFRACPETSFADTIHVFELPKVYLGRDTTLCLKGNPITLRNLYLLPGNNYRYLWSTGDTTKALQVTHPGTYSLTVSDTFLGCNNTESITIAKDCYIDIPNAFSPDGDGVNDYFFPRQLLSGGAQTLHMQILNRWGQVLFETKNIDGRGWDGRFNGKEQPAGVYIYIIEIIMDNGKTEKYKGNITLLR